MVRGGGVSLDLEALAAPLEALLVRACAVALGDDAGDGLLEEVGPLLLDGLPVGVLHDVRVVVLAVGERVALQVLRRLLTLSSLLGDPSRWLMGWVDIGLSCSTAAANEMGYSQNLIQPNIVTCLIRFIKCTWRFSPSFERLRGLHRASK